MTTKEIAEALRLHKLWHAGDKNGQRADLNGAYLIGADLREADLSGTDLRGADLSGADCSDSHTIPDDGTTRIIQIDGVSRRGYRVITAVHDDAIDWVWAGCASMPAAELLAAVEAKYGVEDADRFRDAFEFAIRMRKGERW